MNWNTAKSVFKKENLSLLAILEDGQIYQSKERGIAPIINKMKANPHYFKNAKILDKVIGKAAAMLLIDSGISYLHANVLSKKAKEVLDRAQLSYTYGSLCDYIENRQHNGLCPMEQCVWDVDEVHQAYPMLLKRQAQLQKEGNNMKKLGFGCMRFPLFNKEDQTSIDYEQVKKMVDLFIEKGFTYFDTAYMYHNFMSEKAVKKVLVDRYPRDAYTLASKMPTMFLQGKKEEDMERIFQEQLDNTGVDYFDYYLLHNLNTEHYAIAQKLQAFAFIQKKKAEGKIKQIGFSFHDRAQLLDQILQDHPDVDFVQLQINYLDWDDPGIQSRLCYETAVKHHKKVVVMEPVKGGMLASVPPKAKAVFKQIHEEMSIASWAIRFAADLEEVMVVLSGMSSLEQMKDNLSYMENRKALNEEEQKAIQSVTNIIHESIAIPCTACRYCVEGCPKHIPIPEYFALYNNKKQTKKEKSTLHSNYYHNYAQGHGKAQDCIACHKCEHSCPQHIPISTWMKEISKEFDETSKTPIS